MLVIIMFVGIICYELLSFCEGNTFTVSYKFFLIKSSYVNKCFKNVYY